MADFDSWAILKTNSPLFRFANRFPNGLPIKHPYPNATNDISKTAVFIIDQSRITAAQTIALRTVEKGQVSWEIGYVWVDSLTLGEQGKALWKELEQFLTTDLSRMNEFVRRSLVMIPASANTAQTIEQEEFRTKLNPFVAKLESDRHAKDSQLLVSEFSTEPPTTKSS